MSTISNNEGEKGGHVYHSLSVDEKNKIEYTSLVTRPLACGSIPFMNKGEEGVNLLKEGGGGVIEKRVMLWLEILFFLSNGSMMLKKVIEQNLCRNDDHPRRGCWLSEKRMSVRTEWFLEPAQAF